MFGDLDGSRHHATSQKEREASSNATMYWHTHKPHQSTVILLCFVLLCWTRDWLVLNGQLSTGSKKKKRDETQPLQGGAGRKRARCCFFFGVAIEKSTRCCCFFTARHQTHQCDQTAVYCSRKYSKRKRKTVTEGERVVNNNNKK